MTDDNTIFTRLLSELDVKHTRAFSDDQFLSMPFQSLFGLEKLLMEYGIESCCFKVKSNAQLTTIPTPYLTQTDDGIKVVSGFSSGSVSISDGKSVTTMSVREFHNRCTGIVMGVYPTESAIEPHYTTHMITEVGSTVKRWLLPVILTLLFLYLFVSRGLYSHIYTVLLTVIDCLGLYFSYLLILKQLRIHTRAADRVCGIIQKEGCNKVLNTDASSFFGLFHWCEVGFAYFSVSLLIMLIFPGHIPQLALINLCCLPFTFWSIWYQHFRAKAWCTLCVSIQGLLWLQFLCYLTGGVYQHVLPLTWGIIMTGCCYIVALLLLNRFLPQPKDDDTEP